MNNKVSFLLGCILSILCVGILTCFMLYLNQEEDMASIVNIPSNNIPNDILTGDYEFQIRDTASTTAWANYTGEIWPLLRYLEIGPETIEIRARRIVPGAPTHAEIMTPDVWWEVEGSYRQIVGYNPSTEKYLFPPNLSVTLSWFVGKVSVVTPPE